jgi:hypothetical protein
MSAAAWRRAYEQAWREFYSVENMKAILARAHPRNYWDLFLNLFWYKHAVVNEGSHPMLTGIFRLKDRTTRRALFPREGRLRHALRRTHELARYLAGFVRLALEMEEVWLATRPRSEVEKRVMEELARMGVGLKRGLRIADLQAAYQRVKAQLPSLEAGAVAGATGLGPDLALATSASSVRPARPHPILAAPALAAALPQDEGSDTSARDRLERVARVPAGGGIPAGPAYAGSVRRA